jgi:hypothetical protein
MASMNEARLYMILRIMIFFVINSCRGVVGFLDSLLRYFRTRAMSSSCKNMIKNAACENEKKYYFIETG